MTRCAVVIADFFSAFLFPISRNPFASSSAAFGLRLSLLTLPRTIAITRMSLRWAVAAMEKPALVK